MPNEMIQIWFVVGAIAGGLAGMSVRGGGFGLAGDIVIGIVGALVSGWLLVQLGFSSGSSIMSVMATATLGAVVLLALLRMPRAA